jgi:hypothetical protein
MSGPAGSPMPKARGITRRTTLVPCLLRDPSMPRRTLKMLKACWAALAWLLYWTGRIG